jgi:hypothetical protein
MGVCGFACYPHIVVRQQLGEVVPAATKNCCRLRFL